MMQMKMNQDELTDQITLCDALDRMLNKGVVISGDITVSVAGVELLYIGLRGLVCAIDAMETRPASLSCFPRSAQSFGDYGPPAVNATTSEEARASGFAEAGPIHGKDTFQ